MPKTVTALATLPDRQNAAPLIMQPQTFGESLKMAEVFSQSEIVPKNYRGKPADIVVAFQFGAELGFYPMSSLRHVFVIEGRPTLDAQGMHAVCISSRQCDAFQRDDKQSERGKIEVWFCVRRGVKHYGSFSIDDAKTAGLLGKSNWKNYPADMLENRAIARAARRAFPDRVGGLHTPEEIIDLRETAPNEFSAPLAPAAPVPVQAEVIDVAPEPEPSANVEDRFVAAIATIEHAKDKAELESLAAECGEIRELSADLGGKLAKAYKARLASLRDEQ